MENYGRISYDHYIRTGIRKGTFYYEIENVTCARRKIGQLIIGVSQENSLKPMTILMLDPKWYNWRGEPLANNFYKCTVCDNPYLCFHANGVVFIINDKHYDIESIKPAGDIGELMYSSSVLYA